MYPESYPVDPPFLYFSKLGKNIAVKHEGFQILKKGGVFVKDLNVKNWNLSVKIHLLIKNIVESFINDSSGKIIDYDYDSAYTEYVSIS